MPRRSTLTWSLLAFWLLAGCGYVAAALRQKDRLNLSATAGGQMPYLVYAQHVATDGWFGHFGDRNRMPFVPVLVSLVYAADWQQFVTRASWLAIALSLVLLGGMAFVAYRNLSPLMATAFLLIVAVAVFSPQASFVQADLAYYALFFCSWWAMVRLIDRPTILCASMVGLLLGLTYLTKASVLLAVPIFLGVLVLRALLSRRIDPNFAPKRAILAASVALIVFLGVIFPYLQNNHKRFGRYFYNVNTTFFVWCDSWSQAQHFAEKYSIDRQFPDALPEAIPGPQNYWRTHSMEQIARRIGYGFKTLGRLAVESASFKYLVFLGVCAVVLAIISPSAARELFQRPRWPVLFSILLLGAYMLAYAWYVVVAYGDRFVLSLVPPVLFALCAYIDRVAGDIGMPQLVRLKFAPRPALATALIFFTLADGIAAANTSWITPSPTFVRFYYDESHEELRRGNLKEAQRGMLGVLTLDPGFPVAHRDLGMIALAERRHEDAIKSLSKAAMLEPKWADVYNSLGSAFIQAGRLVEAVPVLERATTLDPKLASAWYNLCGALFQLGERERGNSCLSQLETVSPDLAQRLKSAFDAGSSDRP
jgi:hypothetical protein